MGCLFVSACAGTALKALSEARARVGGSVWCCKLTENEAAVGGWVRGGGRKDRDNEGTFIFRSSHRWQRRLESGDVLGELG